MNPQIRGLENLEGTYIFDIRASNKAFRLNRFFWDLTREDVRERFLSDAEAVMESADLTATEKELVRTQDWLGLVQYGVNFFVIEKFARVTGTTNLEVYALMRGETLDEFLKTRRVPESR